MEKPETVSIIFDLDGVIINSEPIHKEIEKEMMLERGIELSPAEHLSYVGMAGYDMWKAVKEKYCLPESVDDLRREKRGRTQHFLDRMDDSVLVPGALECLRRLQRAGFPLALASSSGQSYVSHVIDRFEIRDYFSVVTTGWDVERSMPAPDIFLLTAERLGARPSSCLVIEDSANGVRAARSAGMAVIAYVGAMDGEQNTGSADWVTSDMGEITAEKIMKLVQSRI